MKGVRFLLAKNNVVGIVQNSNFLTPYFIMKYKNYFRVKVKPTGMDLLKQAITNYNSKSRYKLKIKNCNVYKEMHHVDIRFKSILYLLSEDVYFIMFDFATVYRDTEIDAF